MIHVHGPPQDQANVCETLRDTWVKGTTEAQKYYFFMILLGAVQMLLFRVNILNPFGTFLFCIVINRSGGGKKNLLTVREGKQSLCNLLHISYVSDC